MSRRSIRELGADGKVMPRRGREFRRLCNPDELFSYVLILIVSGLVNTSPPPGTGPRQQDPDYASDYRKGGVVIMRKALKPTTLLNLTPLS